MNILDLKKGDKVFIVVDRNDIVSAGFVISAEVRGCFFYGDSLNVRMHFNDTCKTCLPCIIEKPAKQVYANLEDAFDGKNFYSNPDSTEIDKWLSDRLGCEVSFRTIVAYEWDESEKKAKKWSYDYNGRTDLLSYKLPDGVYPTKEACEKANRKMVSIEVTRTFMTEREEGEDAEWLLNHPDEYEFQEGDEYISDAQYAN